ncbi:MAG: hypothetical protein IJ733_07090 [Lachnospiraceae bacterium]|nr:hypothetical protein [Lachnospiraceae bacterium]
MGYIYIDTNYLHGWSSDSCVGQVDSNGYIYNGVNYISGWGSGSCIGRVDYQDGFVYDDQNVWSGWASSACKGFFDIPIYEKGKPSLSNTFIIILVFMSFFVIMNQGMPLIF